MNSEFGVSYLQLKDHHPPSIDLIGFMQHLYGKQTVIRSSDNTHIEYVY